ncbi:MULTISPECIES: helix-turn-helix transcriptional regulator [Micrococcaceae]|uniref:helix-turn-helix transcriptional regulator n=1 Tax=Micrococcaceae TaxID=1268 RepID=UPI00103582B8|nr:MULTISPECIES: helix-turn-helix transcriptional regulator [Micrococcaceae]TAP27017.1 XRE family transcriptional regulator [Arthrobacter sp. S41]UXN31362.1 helix-turn-helix transcriptional regulator [Glutamicibacter sp. M10]
MNAGQRRREELAAFLKDRRARADRASHGLPEVGRSRVRGLRREEVATLAGVSATWYTWLEQARDINPSRQVMQSLARLFRLSAVETSYLLSLAGHGELAPEESSPMTDALQRLLDVMNFPAFLLSADWAIIGWNAEYAQLYPRITSVDVEDRNLLWLVFTDAQLREMLPDWEKQSRGFVGSFRAETRGWLSPSGETGIVARVSAASAEFAAIWNERDVAGFQTGERVFRHPAKGLTKYEQHNLTPAEAPDLTLLMYTPL